MCKIVIALNTQDKREALDWVDKLISFVEWFKVGFPLYLRTGNEFIEELKKREAKVFLDLKFFDIPYVVSLAVKAASEIGVDMLTLHTLGGFEMLKSARSELDKLNKDKKPLLIGVTVLTSIGKAELKGIGDKDIKLEQRVRFLAKLARSANLDGVVVSGFEIEMIKKEIGNDFITVVPGVRLEEDKSFDQERVVTPQEVKKKGGDFIVLGRPITHSSDPVEKIKRYIEALKT